MSSSQWMTESTGSFSQSAERIAEAIGGADAVLVGAGAGLSTAAGFSYGGKRFEEHFADFHERFGIEDMYTGGFYPFPDKETLWAWWSRMIWVNRYACPVGEAYKDLAALLQGRDYFVLTTNVDHQFQRAGIEKERLFYTQGDYGLFQCSVPCHQETYDNKDMVERMVREQKDMRVPSGLVPRCSRCGEPLFPTCAATTRSSRMQAGMQQPNAMTSSSRTTAGTGSCCLRLVSAAIRLRSSSSRSGAWRSGTGMQRMSSSMPARSSLRRSLRSGPSSSMGMQPRCSPR